MSKGSKKRPMFVSLETFNKNWDKIFEKKDKKKPKNRNTEKSQK